MGTTSGVIFKFCGIEFTFFSAQISTVSWFIIGPILFCVIVVFGFYVFKQLTKKDKVEEEEDDDTDEDLNLGENNGVIRKKIEP